MRTQPTSYENVLTAFLTSCLLLPKIDSEISHDVLDGKNDLPSAKKDEFRSEIAIKTQILNLKYNNIV